MAHASRSIDRAFVFLFAAYSTGLVVANAMGAKLMPFGPWLLSVGTLAYPLTFVLQDVINERYGLQQARTAVLGAALSLACLAALSLITAPLSDPTSPEMTKAFGMVFGSAPRIVLASLCAFTVGGMIDAQLFARLRKRWPSKLLLRKVTSTLISQSFDTIVFVGIAFGGEVSVDSLVAICIGQYLVKQVIAVTGLPITYSLLRVLR